MSRRTLREGTLFLDARIRPDVLVAWESRHGGIGRLVESEPPKERRDLRPMSRFRRAGLEFGQQPRRLAVAELSAEQVDAILNEPLLDVREIQNA